tara:strand:+ start:506 stop:1033 length:528 start_codon:yes stop_codon:yes gene_type:complete
MKKIIIVICFCLLKISTYSQNKKFNCTRDNSEDIWLTESYEKFRFWLEDEKIQVNNESYWLFGYGEGEVSISNSALIIPMKQKTIIYQYLFDKQIVKEVITIEYLSKYFKKLNKNVESNIIANAKYFAISENDKGKVECIKVFYSVEFPPVKNKNNGFSLIDFNKIIKEKGMKDK